MSCKVLVVDDERLIRQLVESVLEEEGFKVVAVGDGSAALEVLSEQSPDVILLDMRMPVMNGWQLAEALRERGIEVPIVVMTAARDVRQWAAEVGAVGYVAKPFDVDDLVMKVRAALPLDAEGC